MNKYHAIPTVVDGIRFASKKEANRYSELKLLEKAREIEDLELQPKYPIKVNGNKICVYIADFRYWDIQHREVVVEDVKSKPTKTPVYRLKKKLFEAIYPIKVTEVE